MLQSLPNEVLQTICLCLINDGCTIGRLALCSQDLYQRISRDNPFIWTKAIQWRWCSTHSMTEFETKIDDYDDDQPTGREDPRSVYIRRHLLDNEALKLVNQMTIDLKYKFDTTEEEDNVNDDEIVSEWHHPPGWRRLLEMGDDIMEGLQQRARLSSMPSCCPTDNHDDSLQDRLRSFITVRVIQAIHFSQCLHEWRRIAELEYNHQMNQDPGRDVHPSQILERYALLMIQLQQTPLQLVNRDISIRSFVLESLDELANRCRHLIQEAETTGATVGNLETIRIISIELFERQDFKGNTDDYYNYRNSLLDQVLKTRKGIPITLAILFVCVCRRLGITAGIIGLPGHVVSCFSTEDGKQHYVDVFHKGKLLNINDCRRICESYGVSFDERFMIPLSPDKIVERILNNLGNTHLHGTVNPREPFQPDLWFQQRILSSVHRQPREGARQMVDLLAKDLPFTTSPALLNYYRLSSP